MSFIVGMPESGATLGSTRKLFVNELAGMRSTMSENHVDQNTPVDFGKHEFIQFTNVTASTTSATELALYNKSVSGNQRFFIRQPSSGTEIQISGIDPIAEKKGCVFLPGGLLLQWGKSVVPKNTGGKLTYFAKKGADGFVRLRIIGLTVASNAVTIGHTNALPVTPADDGFTAFLSSIQSTDTEFNYWVIGTMT